MLGKRRPVKAFAAAVLVARPAPVCVGEARAADAALAGPPGGWRRIAIPMGAIAVMAGLGVTVLPSASRRSGPPARGADPPPARAAATERASPPRLVATPVTEPPPRAGAVPAFFG